MRKITAWTRIVAAFAVSSVFPLAASLLLVFVVSQTSQGLELARWLKSAPTAGKAAVGFAWIYLALCTWTASMISVVSNRRLSEKSGARLLPYWLVLANLAAIVSLAVRGRTQALVTLILGCVALIALSVTGKSKILSAKASRTFVITGLALLLLTVGALTFVTVMRSPVDTPRALGAVVLLFVAFGFWPLLATVTFVAIPQKLRLPSLALLPVLMFLSFATRNDNHPLRVTQDKAESPQDTSQTLDKQVRDWLLEHCERNPNSPRGCPMVFVAAEGGGLRASYWTAAVLNELERESEGDFTRHLFAISGVSGGAIGAAAFTVATADVPDDCPERAHYPLMISDDVSESQGTSGQEERSCNETRARKIREFLSEDFLSPVIAGLLFPDLLQRFLPFRVGAFDRAIAFEHALERSWYLTFNDHRFEGGFNEFWNSPERKRRKLRVPALFLNTTNVETGKRFIISHYILPAEDRVDSYFAFDHSALYRIRDMPLSAAVHAASRFPFVSPHASVSIPNADPGGSGSGGASTIWGRIVDGGYYENSGAATATELVNSVTRIVQDLHSRGELPQSLNPDMTLIVLSNDPTTPLVAGSKVLRPPPAHPLGLAVNTPAMNQEQSTTPRAVRPVFIPELLSPIETLFATRSAHSAAAKVAAARDLGQISSAGRRDCALRLAEEHRESTTADRLLQQMRADVKMSFQDLEACAPTRGYDEVSLADILLEERRSASVSSTAADELKDTGNPGLGWYLSDDSKTLMDRMAKLAVRRSDMTVLAGLRRAHVPPTEDERFSRRNILSRFESSPMRCDNAELQSELNRALLFSAVEGTYVEAKCALEKGASANSEDPFGNTALDIALFNRNLTIGELLLSKGANPNLGNTTSGVSPLLRIIGSRETDVLEMLLRHGADINIGNPDSVTPLMAAAYRCDKELVSLLLRRGAKTELRDKEGKRAADWVPRKCRQVPSLLRKSRVPQ